MRNFNFYVEEIDIVFVTPSDYMLLRVRSLRSTLPYRNLSWIIAFGTISQFHFKILADFCVSFDCCLFEFRFAHSTQNPCLENLPAKTFIPLSKSYRFFVVSSVFWLNRVGWLRHTAHWQIFAKKKLFLKEH